MNYYTYLLRCADGSLYCGWTNDLAKRFAAHNAGTASKYTRSRLPVTMVYAEAHGSKQEAMRREYAIKHMTRAKKEALITAEQNLIIKHSATQNRVLMRVGGDASDSFSAPCSISSDERYLYVCNPGANKINRVDLRDFTVSDFKRFDEPVYKYIVSGEREFVVLRSGVYML